MRIRQIGSTVFDNSTNIVVDATALDAVGGGFRVNDLDGPQPFAVEVAFIRSTRQQVLEALNLLAYDLYIRSQRRTFANVAGGVVVWIENKSGNSTLRSYLTNASVNLVSIENGTVGIIARARVTGTLIGPFAASSHTTETFSSLRAYGLYTLPLSNLNNSDLAIHSFTAFINNNTGLRNVLFVCETLENFSRQSRIRRISPSSVSSNLVLESFSAEPGTTLQRARFATSGSGTITYYAEGTTTQNDIYNLFFEVFLPSVPSSDIQYTISWDTQPAINGIVDYNKTFIRAGIYARSFANTTITIYIPNAPANTYISPILLIPTDGTFVFNATAPNVSYLTASEQIEGHPSLFASGSDYGELRGPPGFIAGKYLAFFAGMMTPTISNLTTNVTIQSRLIEPASFM